jgi:hypothetical protein
MPSEAALTKGDDELLAADMRIRAAIGASNN